jgi:hypothetical protein
MQTPVGAVHDLFSQFIGVVHIGVAVHVGALSVIGCKGMGSNKARQYLIFGMRHTKN